MLLERVQSNEQIVEETHTISKTSSQNQEAEIGKQDKNLCDESVMDTNDTTTKEEIFALELEPVDEVLKGENTDLNETTEVEPQEDPKSLETTTKDTSNSEKEKADSDNLPVEDLKIVCEVKIPEMVSRLEKSVLKEEYFVPETETNLDKEKGTAPEQILSDEKTEQTTEIKQEAVKEVCEETNLEKTEYEEPKLYDSCTVKINEKEVTTFKDDDQEKDHMVNVSTERQGMHENTSSQNEAYEEKWDLQ
ncbi:hypothetical protein R6Q59_035027 [Mikania micrantha]